MNGAGRDVKHAVTKPQQAAADVDKPEEGEDAEEEGATDAEIGFHAVYCRFHYALYSCSLDGFTVSGDCS